MSTNGELSRYVTLVSSDGYEFSVRRDAAGVSGTVQRMLNPQSGFEESTTGRCIFHDIK
jgi:transcription elongation factor B subunit 1